MNTAPRTFHESRGIELELSMVIPVYNGARAITDLVENILSIFKEVDCEVVLVDDGSNDASESICRSLAEAHPSKVIFIRLSRNFGEQHAVMAGLNFASGKYVAVLDDDGQNPPEEIIRMLQEIKAKNYDVVYGHYIVKRHSWFRNLGSRFNDFVATVLLGKPSDLYLSSFKVMNRFTVNEVIQYRGAFPYIDGLIYRMSKNLGQIPVQHRASAEASRYDLNLLMRLWFNMFMGFSIAPLRIAAMAGVCISILSLFFMISIIVNKLFITKVFTFGFQSILATVIFFAGVQLMILGLIGEYLGRLFLNHSGMPQFVIRYVRQNGREKSGSGLSRDE